MADPKADHNAGLLTQDQRRSTIHSLKALRMLLDGIAHFMLKMDLKGADLTLALRHTEDARMRCGKALSPFPETGFLESDTPDDDIFAFIAEFAQGVADRENKEGETP